MWKPVAVAVVLAVVIIAIAFRVPKARAILGA